MRAGLQLQEKICQQSIEIVQAAKKKKKKKKKNIATKTCMSILKKKK